MLETINSLSMPISPNSLTKTAVLSPCWLVRIWLRRVVLPLPRKPVMIVTGRPKLGVSRAGVLLGLTAVCMVKDVKIDQENVGCVPS